VNIFLAETGHFNVADLLSKTRLPFGCDSMPEAIFVEKSTHIKELKN